MTEIKLQDLNTIGPGPYRFGGIVGFLKWNGESPYLGLDIEKLHRIERGDKIEGCGDKEIYEIV